MVPRLLKAAHVKQVWGNGRTAVRLCQWEWGPASSLTPCKTKKAPIMGLQALFFYLFAFVAVASAFMVIAAQEPGLFGAVPDPDLL